MRHHGILPTSITAIMLLFIGQWLAPGQLPASFTPISHMIATDAQAASNELGVWNAATLDTLLSPEEIQARSELLVATARRVITPDIDVDASLLNKGRQVRVSGPLVCSAAYPQVSIRLTVTQRDTGALAESRWRGACPTNERKWTTTAAAYGPNSFQEGAAQGCALAVVYERGRRLDAFQWCRDIRLTNR